MAVRNGNGNGNGTSKPPVRVTQEPAADAGIDSSADNLEESLPNVEDLLKGAAAEAKKSQAVKETEELKGEEPADGVPSGESSADVTQIALSKTAQDLVTTTEAANADLLTAGIEQGLEDVKANFSRGYQIGLLKGIEKTIGTNSQELGLQLKSMRQHLAGKPSAATEKIVGSLDSGETSEKPAALEGLDDLVKKHMSGGGLSIL